MGKNIFVIGFINFLLVGLVFFYGYFFKLQNLGQHWHSTYILMNIIAMFINVIGFFILHNYKISPFVILVSNLFVPLIFSLIAMFIMRDYGVIIFLFIALLTLPLIILSGITACIISKKFPL